MYPSSGGFLITGVTAPNRGTIPAVELEIDPEPDEAEREAIVAAIERATAKAPALDAWRAAALLDAVEEPVGEPFDS